MPDNSSKFNPNLNLDIPKWINAKYFEKILKNDVVNFKRILKFCIIPATPPGENYTSMMLRIKMDIEMDEMLSFSNSPEFKIPTACASCIIGEKCKSKIFMEIDGFTEQKSYIMKTMLDNDKGGTFLNTLNLFPKEKIMYETILPQLEALYEEFGSKVKFAPKCPWIEEKSGRITLVLEDLLTKKFRNINRLKGFDMAHIKRVLEKLAEFHAASVILQERIGSYSKEFTNTYLPANYQKSKSYQARLQSYKAAMSSWGLEDYEKYVKRIPNAEQYVNATLQCFSEETNEFRVLNHGDFWSSNIMLNYASNGVTNSDINQIRFVDFQLCKWASPAMDLWEIIICSVESNLRIRNFDLFIRIYHTHLLKSLKFLKYEKPMPLLSDLHISMLRHGFWGYFTSFTHLVMILLPSDKEASLLKLMQPGEEGDKFRMKAFTNPLYVRAILDILPFLYRRGLLEFD